MLHSSTEIKSPLRELRALRREGLGDRHARLLSVLSELGSPLDLEAAGALLSGASERAALRGGGHFREQRIALLGSSTLHVLPNLLTAHLVKRAILPAVVLGGFNQWRHEGHLGTPELCALRPRIVACLLDDSAVFSGVKNALDLGEVEAACQTFSAELARWVDGAARTLGGRIVLSTLPLSPLSSGRLIDYKSRARLSRSFCELNARIFRLAEEDPRTLVLDFADLARRTASPFADARTRLASSQVFSTELLSVYAEELARVSAAELGLAKKCLVLDLDNTLWGGVVGDEGAAALRIGGGYPGTAHLELQELARDLSQQGVMLTVCSKNEHDVAIDAIASHPEMCLRTDAFVSFSANWDPKPDNIKAQSQQLNIGLDAMVFVDDNPVERGLVRERLPEVLTLDLPKDPARYAEILADAGAFNLLELTAEDRGRTELYRARAERASHAKAATSIDDYLASLDSCLTLEPVTTFNRPRVAQLFGKTNQFNLTGVRYSEEQLAQLEQTSSFRLLAARLSDRFGDHGLIAAMAVLSAEDRSWTIESFVMSCRVFSRRVEDALLATLLRDAAEAGQCCVVGRFRATSKNQQFRDLYLRFGFAQTSADGVFTHSLSQLPALPSFVRVERA